MQAELRIDSLPESPLDAGAAFHRECVEKAHRVLGGDADSLVIVLPAAPSDHDDWRRAMARDLGRKYAPKRVNLLGGGEAGAVDAMLAYLGAAPGITGQYLALHD